MCRRILGALLALCLFVPAGRAAAQLRLHPLFTDGVVLQRGGPIPVWGTAPDGARVTVDLEGKSVYTIARNGQWKVKLPARAAGGPFLMVVASAGDTIRVRDVLVGEVWVASGQSNMGFLLRNATGADTLVARAGDPMLRLFAVKRDTSLTPKAMPEGAWAKDDTASAAGFSAVAYLFGRELRRELGVPVGIIGTYWGGTNAETWTGRPVMERVPETRALIERADAMKKDPSLRKGPVPRNPWYPSMLYNAMVAPLVDYPVAGVIWYQGESNARRAGEYRTLFPTLIQSWRLGWERPNLPFLFVQLPGFLPDSTEPAVSSWAALRDAQLHTTRTVPYTAMAVAIDQGEAHDIHPKRKDVVAHRLALAALGSVYGRKLEHVGPRFAGMSFKGDTAVLRFDHVGKGLVLRKEATSGFQLRNGTDSWKDASAELRGDRVYVWAAGTGRPGAVRYGWMDLPPATLWNEDGLPASPFSTAGN